MILIPTYTDNLANGFEFNEQVFRATPLNALKLPVSRFRVLIIEHKLTRTKEVTVSMFNG